MSIPKLSICTTNYNCAHALRQHLESIYSQLDESEFEYIVVDSKSKDASMDILREFSSSHGNMTVLEKKCIRGIGRQIAFEQSTGNHIIQVDTDTEYLPMWKPFLDMSMERYPGIAVQAIFSGIYPRDVLEEVGGWSNFQYAEDFELWMRLWKIGKMKWYPSRVGINIKDREGYEDIFSQRFSKKEAVIRLLQHEYDWIRLHNYRNMDIISIFKNDSIDLGLGNLEDEWIGRRKSLGPIKWSKRLCRNVLNILANEG